MPVGPTGPIAKAEPWRTVRAFISSTFRDMHAERDHLVKVVFPALRERLEAHHVHLVDIDLRWGVTREQAENDQALDLCLQQIDACRPFFIGLLGERYGWVPRGFPADALAHYGWIQQHPGKSVTELEMLHGALDSADHHGHALFYFRDPKALDGLPPDIKEAAYTEADPERRRKLADLKDRIRESGHPVMESYPARWAPGLYDQPRRSKGRLVELEAFGERVREDLWAAITTVLSLPATPSVVVERDPWAAEQDDHERFMESRLRIYVGRDALHQQLLADLGAHLPKPLLVTGSSGAGKSALLAQLARAGQSRYSVVIPHFVGASAGSANVRHTLRRLCVTLQTAFRLEGEIPEEIDPLIATFRGFLASVPASHSVLLVIDAIDQFDLTDHAHELGWLPTTMPRNVGIVVSCIDEPGGEHPVLRRSRHLGLTERPVPPLTGDERQEIIRQVPSLSAKTLGLGQASALLANPATANPLFLLVALEELRGFGSYEQLSDRIAALPCEGETVTALFTQVIERLEAEYDIGLVRNVLTLVAAARRGLSERELQGVLATVDTPNDLFHVLRQLRPYLLRRAGLIGFYHRNLLEAVRLRYMATAPQQRAAHTRVADYFNDQPLWQPTGERAERQANARMLEELPWQRLRAEQWTELEALLCDVRFIEAKCSAAMVHDLVLDYQSALAPSRLPPILRPSVEEFASFVRLRNYALGTHPSLVLQEAANQPETTMPAREARRLLTQTPERPWLRRIDKRISSSCLLTFGGHEAGVVACAYSPDGTRALSASHDGTLRLWDVDTGAPVAVLSGHEAAVESCVFFPNGQQVVSAGRARSGQTGEIHLWDAVSGAPIVGWTGHGGTVNACAVSPDGALVLTASEDGTLGLWDARNQSLLRILHGHEGGVTGCAFSPDGRYIASAALDGDLRLWEARTGHAVARWPVNIRALHSCTFSPDGALIAAGSGFGTITLWDVATQKPAGQLTGHRRQPYDIVVACCFSPDGNRLASACYDYSVRLWDVRSTAEMACFAGHTGAVYCCAFAPDGTRLLSGAADGLKLWDLTGSTGTPNRPGHGGRVTTCSFSPDGRLIASGAEDRTIKLWEGATGAEAATLLAKEDRLTGLGLLLTMTPSLTIAPPQAAHQFPVEACTFLPDGSQLLSLAVREIHSGSELKLWDVATRTELWKESSDSLSALSRLGGADRREWRTCAISLDGSRFLLGGTYTSSKRTSRRHTMIPLPRRDDLEEWTFTNLPLLAYHDAARSSDWVLLDGHTAPVHCCAFSPDGTWFVSASDDHSLVLWEAAAGQNALALAGHTAEVYGCAISPDGRRIASTSADATLRLWDAASGRDLARATSARLDRSCAFSPDGHLVATTGDRLTVWDAERLVKVAEYWTDGGFGTVAWRPDGRALCAGDNSGQLHLLELEHYVPGPPIVSVVHRFYRGRFDLVATVMCPWCTEQFAPPATVMDVIREARLHRKRYGIVSRVLPDEIASDSRLWAECPACRLPLRFNALPLEPRPVRPTRTTFAPFPPTPLPEELKRIESYNRQLTDRQRLPWWKRIMRRSPKHPTLD